MPSHAIVLDDEDSAHLRPRFAGRGTSRARRAGVRRLDQSCSHEGLVQQRQVIPEPSLFCRSAFGCAGGAELLQVVGEPAPALRSERGQRAFEAVRCHPQRFAVL